MQRVHALCVGEGTLKVELCNPALALRAGMSALDL